MSAYDPFSVQPAFEAVQAAEDTGQRSYPGIGRLAYFGLSILIGIVFQVFGALADASGLLKTPESAIAFLAIFILLNFICSVTIIVLRLQNLGMNGFWVLGLIVPILNLVIAVRLIAAPAGYADHKTLDLPGKILVGSMIALFLLGLALLFVVG